MSHYMASPAHRCLAPSQCFKTPLEATRFAEQAAILYHVAFVVWSLGKPRWRQIAYLPAPKRRV